MRTQLRIHRKGPEPYFTVYPSSRPHTYTILGVLEGGFRRGSSKGTFEGCHRRASLKGVFGGSLQRASSKGVLDGRL